MTTGFFWEKCNPLYGVIESLLHLLTPQGVNEGVQQRGHSSGGHWDTFIYGHLFFCQGFDIDEDTASIGDGNYNHVGWVGRKGLFPVLDWGKPQNYSNFLMGSTFQMVIKQTTVISLSREDRHWRLGYRISWDLQNRFQERIVKRKLH